MIVRYIRQINIIKQILIGASMIALSDNAAANIIKEDKKTLDTSIMRI
jgi:hypothetical protein